MTCVQLTFLHLKNATIRAGAAHADGRRVSALHEHDAAADGHWKGRVRSRDKRAGERCEGCEVFGRGWPGRFSDAQVGMGVILGGVGGLGVQ